MPHTRGIKGEGAIEKKLPDCDKMSIGISSCLKDKLRKDDIPSDFLKLQLVRSSYF
jgi:hypothetical protein